ncbi:MAG: iron ABC transporter permease [Pacificimonas sp.]|jgi:iron(III) transport system permease protein|nr:iron ABC transporter permease [Pacificimonas sp.]
MGRGSAAWTLSALVIAALVAVPILAVLWSLPAGGLAAWQEMGRAMLPTYIGNTLALMLMTGALAAVMGVGTAWLVAATRFPGRGVLAVMLILPLAVPAYLLAYIYGDLLAFSGPVQGALRAQFGWGAGDYWFPPVRSLPAAATMLALCLYPYVYLLARTAFAAQSARQFLAARTLGLTAGRAFFRVALPSARPAIAGGLALVMMETLADFGVADFLAIPTFSTGIFRSWLLLGDRDAAMKLAALMLLFVMLLIALESAGRRGRVDTREGAGGAPLGAALTGWAGIGALVACALPVLFGFAVPVAVLFGNSLTVGDGKGAALWGYLGDSLSLAAITAGIASVVALVLAYAQRQSGSALVRGGIRVATLGYALPGALLAVGLLLPLGALDQEVTRAARGWFGPTQGLVLSGSGAVLIYALSVRFMTVAHNSVTGGMAKIPPSMDAAARSLGETPLGVVRRVHLPQLRLSLAAGAALVFIDTLRELPATLILRPFNVETLATRVYRLASDERLAEASTAALLIVAAGLVPVLILTRMKR